MTITRIDDLRPDPENLNVGTPRGHAMIEESIRQHGAGRPGLAAKDGTMIAGSQTLEEMLALGFEIVPVHTTGKQWPVHIRDDIEPGSEEARALAIADNQSAAVGLKWDDAAMARLADTGFDLSPFFTSKELEERFAGVSLQLVSSDTPPTANSPPIYSQPGEHGNPPYAAPEDGSNALPPSYIRMVQLFLTTETQPEFLQLVQALMPHFEKDNLTDTVVEAVRYAHDHLDEQTA